MPRENSFSDSEGRSLTPDLSDEEHEFHVQQPSQLPASPTSAVSPAVGSTHGGLHDLALITSRLSKHSAQTKKSQAATAKSPVHVIPGWKTLTPKDRFKAAVRRVMAMRRTTTGLIGTGVRGRVGAEPGVDPRHPSADLTYGHLQKDCVIEIIDYSALRTSFGRMTNKEFVDLMNSPGASRRDPWVKVRWINIGGLSWDVIKAVSLKYNLHPLALEDVFHGHAQNRSKADYYTRHLFLRVLCHELGDLEDANLDPSLTAAYGSTLTSEPEPMEEEEMKEEMNEKAMDEEKTMYASTQNSKLSPSRHMRRRRPILPTNNSDIGAFSSKAGSNSRLAGLMKTELAAKTAKEKMKEQEASLDALKKGERVNVKVCPMFIFLFRDGTVISFHPTPDLEFTSPISARLRQTDTVLRKSADASLLVQALLDLIVDRSMQVIDEYHTKINKFERNILIRPNMKTVRALHILSGDLILRKRTLEPIKTLLYGLRRYDVDRCAALIDTSDPANADVKAVGFMSHKAKIYLADVYDHMEYILTSLDMFADITENLIDYTFNLASYEMNEVMRRLTLATIIFLPLTLLTGYFGMNFSSMFSVDKHSDLFFWEVALPVMAVVVPLFMWSDFKRMYHYIQKRLTVKRAVKTIKEA